MYNSRISGFSSESFKKETIEMSAYSQIGVTLNGIIRKRKISNTRQKVKKISYTLVEDLAMNSYK